MAITFDLNTLQEEFIDQTLWESAPLDTVMIVAALGALPDEPKPAPLDSHQVRFTASDSDDADAITWEDAEWR